MFKLNYGRSSFVALHWLLTEMSLILLKTTLAARVHCCLGRYCLTQTVAAQNKMMLTHLSSPLSQVRSHIVVHGKTATGVLPGRMSSPDTTGNTPGLNPSSASPATAASHAQTTWPCTWGVIRINTDPPSHKHHTPCKHKLGTSRRQKYPK